MHRFRSAPFRPPLGPGVATGLTLWVFAAVCSASLAAEEPEGGPRWGSDGVHRVAREERVVHEFRYVVILPPDYRSPEHADRRWPLVLRLHGSGRKNPARAFGVEPDPRFIQLIPLTENRREWDVPLLVQLITTVRDGYRVDDRRISVVGFSMGAMGAWDLASRAPELVSAIVPIGGSGDPYRISRGMRHVPVWAFHGARDDSVPVHAAELSVECLQRAGGEARLTVFPDEAHTCQQRVYDDPAVFEWLLAQRRQTLTPDELVGCKGSARSVEAAPSIEAPWRAEEWAAAEPLTGFRYPRAGLAERQSEARLLYDREHLYLAVRMAEPAVEGLRADRSERDGPLWEDDSLEVMLDVDDDPETYHQIIVNPAGVVYDGQGFDRNWDCAGLRASALIGADAWTVRLAVPWAALGVDPPEAGDDIRILLARMRRAAEPVERTQWPQTGGHNHMPERFATITLE